MKAMFLVYSAVMLFTTACMNGPGDSSVSNASGTVGRMNEMRFDSSAIAVPRRTDAAWADPMMLNLPVTNGEMPRSGSSGPIVPLFISDVVTNLGE